MQKWAQDLIKAPVKKPIPILSFPSVDLMDITVRDLIYDSGLQSKGMKMVADRADAGA